MPASLQGILTEVTQIRPKAGLRPLVRTESPELGPTSWGTDATQAAVDDKSLVAFRVAQPARVSMAQEFRVVNSPMFAAEGLRPGVRLSWWLGSRVVPLQQRFALEVYDICVRSYRILHDECLSTVAGCSMSFPHLQLAVRLARLLVEMPQAQIIDKISGCLAGRKTGMAAST